MITAAAIRSINGVVWMRDPPARHAEILAAMPRTMRATGTQGFITDDGQFLTRAEAAAHALQCGQIDAAPATAELFTEDLW